MGCIPWRLPRVLCEPTQCFGAIGEAFEDLNVVGVAMASRPHWDNLSVWTREAVSTEAKFRIGYGAWVVCGASRRAAGWAVAGQWWGGADVGCVCVGLGGGGGLAAH